MKNIHSESKTSKPSLYPKWRGYLLTGFTALLFLLAVVQYSRLYSEGARYWQVLSILAFSILAFFSSVRAIWWISQYRILLVSRVLISLLLAYGILNAFVFTDLGILMQLFIILTGILIVLELRQPGKRTKDTILVLTMGFIAFSSDLFRPYWRMPASTITFHSIMVLIVAGFLGFYILRNFTSFSFHTRLLLVILGIDLIATFLLAVITTSLTRQIILNNINRKLTVAVAGLSDDIDEFIDYQQTELRTKADTKILKDYLRLPPESRRGSKLEGSVLALLKIWDSQDAYNLSYGLLDTSGLNVLDSSQDYINQSEREFEHFRVPSSGYQPFVSSIYFYKEDTPVITFSAPIQDPRGFVGVLRLNINPEILQSYVEEYNEWSGPQSFGALFDEAGVLLAHGIAPSLNYRPLPGLTSQELQNLLEERQASSSARWFDLPDLINLLNSQRLPSTETQMIVADRRVQGIAAVKSLSKQNWKALIFQPNEYAFIPVQTMVNAIFLVTEVAGILVLLFGHLSALYFTKPFQELSAAAQKFARGNLDVKVDLSRQDEIGSLVQNFNDMASQIRSTLMGLEERIQERTRMIEIGADISQRISAILDPTKLIQEVVKQIQTAFQYDVVKIYLLDENKEILQLAGSSGGETQALVREEIYIQLGNQLPGRAAQQKSVLLETGTTRLAEVTKAASNQETPSEAAVPILLGKDLIGILYVQQKRANSLSAQDTDLLQLISSQVATALQNARAIEEAKKRAEREARLSRVKEQIRGNLEIDRALKVTIREVGRATSAPRSYIRIKRDI